MILPSSPTATEGGAAATFTVLRMGDAPLTSVNVTASITLGDPDVDAPSPTSFTLDDSNPSQVVTVPATNDNIDEPGEPFNLRLTPSGGLPLLDAAGTVVDNDDPPVFSINSVSANEGAAGLTAFVFTITTSRQSTLSPQVSWAAANGTALVTEDFDAASGSVTFGPAETTKQITVNVRGDAVGEPDETFVVNLSAPSNGTIGTAGSGVGTILNDDALATLSVADVTINEAGGNAAIIVTRTGPSATPITVNVATSSGTATQPADYTPVTTQVSIGPSGTSDPVNVPIVNDVLDEPDAETFTVTLSNPIGATISDATATFTITDNDPLPQLSINGPSTVTEPGAGQSTTLTFTVSLTPVSGRTVTVNWGTVAGTADGTDFTAAGGSLSFDPGDAPKTVSVTVLGDALNEANETFSVALASPGNATVGGGAAQVTIVDPSAPPVLGISNGVVSEGDGTVALEVTKAGSTVQTVTVKYAGQNGANFPSATLGADFTLAPGTLTFLPGETTKTITVGIVNDSLGEADESFVVVLSSQTPAGVTLAPSTATVKIVDNDAGGTSPTTTRPNPPPPPPTSITTTKPPSKKLRVLQARVLWAKFTGKTKGQRRAAIRITLNKNASGRVVMIQGKRKVRSAPFELRAGNRTVFILMPKNVKKGRVDFQLLIETATDKIKTLKTKLVLKA